MTITITDGFRCQARQQKLRGTLPAGHTAVGRSTHEDADATDITGPDLPKLRALCHKYFKAVGVANTFFHVDERADKVRLWFYV